MKNTNTDIQSIWVYVNGTMEEENINSISAEHLIQYLDNLYDWDYDETLPIMESLCERLGLDLADYEYCDDCFDAITAAYQEWKAKTDRDVLKFHIHGGTNGVGPLVTFKVMKKAPDNAVMIALDPENRVKDDDVINDFDYYRTDAGYVAVRREL